MFGEFVVTEERVIQASPELLFSIVADPAMHPRMDGSGSVRSAQDGNPERLSLGAQFGMQMHLAKSYSITNTVIEFEEGRRLAWRHFNGHVWRYVFEPVGNGTRVIEQWDSRPARGKITLQLLGFARRNRRGMRATLQRLEQLATEGPASCDVQGGWSGG
jgi:uncharacterized protein YndB with AHSA1/START domain